MYVRTLNEIIGSERDVDWGSGQSRRLLVESDSTGFALADTTIKAGTDLQLQYKNHLEAVYCIEGRGTLTDVVAGKLYDIEPGVMYVLNNQDLHRIRATENIRVICVFNPPIKGDEKHDTSKLGSSY